MVIAMMGPTSSRAPAMAASKAVLPSRMFRSTFSTTTMASSTTRPTASTMASSVSRFTVKPNTCMRKTAPMSETGIATSGTSTVRSEPRNRKMTTMTISTVSVSVWTTSWMALLMYVVESKATSPFMPVGSSARTSSISLRTLAMTSTELALGSTHTPMNTARLPERRTSLS